MTREGGAHSIVSHSRNPLSKWKSRLSLHFPNSTHLWKNPPQSARRASVSEQKLLQRAVVAPLDPKKWNPFNPFNR